MTTPSIIIQKKRDGKELRKEEIRDFIFGLLKGEVADYQATALLMAIFFRGMTLKETVALTEAMVESGERYDLSTIPGPKVDKHSTGGVGDKVSLILAPLAAACGLKVPMMSGRGLGHTGGTLDKLESIPGFNVRLEKERFFEVLQKVGCAMIGQSTAIAPADRKLYALRDVTGTVECIPLIAASILSKKIAEGTEALILDVKVGSGAFMKTLRDARALTKELKQVATKLGLNCKAVLSSMEQPLGFAVGNAVEVHEAICILKNERSKSFNDVTSCDLKELTLQLCAQMLMAGKTSRSIQEARKLASAKLLDGSAWQKFKEMAQAQGGDETTLEASISAGLSRRQIPWKSRKTGYITAMDTMAIGQLLVELGGGRKRAEDTVDPSVGFVFHKKLGAKVLAGETLLTVLAPKTGELTKLENTFNDSIVISSSRKNVPKLILDPGGK